MILTHVSGKDILQRLESIKETDKYITVYSTETADIDDDGEFETVSIGPGMFSGLSSFHMTITDNGRVNFSHSFISSSISQTLVKGNDGKLRLRAEYDDEVIYYDILPQTKGILLTKDGNGLK